MTAIEICIAKLQKGIDDLERSGNDIIIQEHKGKYPYIERVLLHQQKINHGLVMAYEEGIRKLREL
jgi:hypothetical protein